MELRKQCSSDEIFSAQMAHTMEIIIDMLSKKGLNKKGKIYKTNMVYSRCRKLKKIINLSYRSYIRTVLQDFNFLVLSGVAMDNPNKHPKLALFSVILPSGETTQKNRLTKMTNLKHFFSYMS